MEPKFSDFTFKYKLTYVLLSCLDYGCSKGDSIERIKKRLKLANDSDIYRIRCCIDLIQDTEDAIQSFAEYGLEKFSSRNNKKKYSEIYIRLYGMLNAIYLQSRAIIELYGILNIPNKNAIQNDFKKLQISEIRNIAGAHTVDFDSKSKLSSDGLSKRYFQISQMTITPKSEELNVVGESNELRTYNLYESFIEYNKIAELHLYNGVIDYFNKVLKSERLRQNILEHYEINGLIHFDYRKLYQNDILFNRFRAKNRRLIKESMGKHFNINDIPWFMDDIFLKNK